MRKIIFITAITLASCERGFEVEQCCCDWNAANFEPEYNGHNVNQLYFTGSDMCNNELCIYY
tara:strand:- start:390 stop:575 length:186 start_codon:yes stop_codon:yes gene_type:complete